jgi:hypothetical protein
MTQTYDPSNGQAPALTREDLQLIDESLALLAYELNSLELRRKSLITPANPVESKALADQADRIRDKIQQINSILR